MKGRVAALDRLPDGRRAAALIVDGRLADILIEPPERWGPAQPGAIFRAKAGRPMKGLGGMMVDLGSGQGFLREAKGIAPGTPLIVQVTTAPEPGKAPPVTRRVLFKSRYAIATPERSGVNVSRKIQDEERQAMLRALGREVLGPEDTLGLILRAAAASADPDAVAEDAAGAADLARAVSADTAGPPCLLVAAPDPHLEAWREWPAPDLADEDDGAFARHGVWEALDATLSPRVALGGADMTVEPTRAFVAVDVNTRGETAPGAGLKANVAALRALPGALRLRGLGGQIVVDPAPFPKREKSQLEQVLKAAVKSDGSEMSLAGWTPLGHLEAQRKRDRHPLKELLGDALSHL